MLYYYHKYNPTAINLCDITTGPQNLLRIPAVVVLHMTRAGNLIIPHLLDICLPPCMFHAHQISRLRQGFLPPPRKEFAKKCRERVRRIIHPVTLIPLGLSVFSLRCAGGCWASVGPGSLQPCWLDGTTSGFTSIRW